MILLTLNVTSKPTSECRPCGHMKAKLEQWLCTDEVEFTIIIFGSTVRAIVDHRGSTKKANLAARRVESLLLAQAEENGGVVLRKRSPLLRDFKIRFLEWVEGNTTLKQKTKDYCENGWRLLEGTDIAAMRLNAITKDDADRLTFPGGPSNHNNALRTLRRMLGKAEEWTIIKASPKIKLMQEHARERVIDTDIEAKLCLSANSCFRLLQIP